MVEFYLIKLAHKWILRHKLRYALSWISFALVSVVLISIYSIGINIQDGIKSQMKVSPQNYQISIKNLKQSESDAAIKRDITKTTAKDLCQQTNASDMRILFDSSLFISEINGIVQQPKGKVSFVDTKYPLLLNKDIEYIKYLMPSNTDFGFSGRLFNETDSNSAVVTSAFLQTYNLTNDDALGSIITFRDEHGEKYTFKVVGILSYADILPILMNSLVYLPYSENLDETLKSELSLSVVTYDFASGSDMNSVEQTVSASGYVYSRSVNDAETINSLTDSITYIGSFIGLLLFGLSSIGLINSILVTINENLSFMNFFRIIGLKRPKYNFIICYTAALQGVIGGVIGALCSLVFQTQILYLFQLLNFKWDVLLRNFKIESLACFGVLLFCILISILTSFLSLLGTKKHVAIYEIYNEN